jgi:RNA polymerase subunit RPABC4/transcription elongation factor Spt4
MQCSNCGKNIPLTGNVCPYCGADKEQDRQRFIAMFLGLCAGAYIAVQAGFRGLEIVGTTIVCGLVAMLLLRWVRSRSKRPDVEANVIDFAPRISTVSSQPTPQSERSLAADPCPNPAAVIRAVPEGMKKCPDCAELVKSEARICRYCRHDFVSTGSTGDANQVHQTSASIGSPAFPRLHSSAPGGSRNNKARQFSISEIAIGIVAGIVILACVVSLMHGYLSGW